MFTYKLCHDYIKLSLFLIPPQTVCTKTSTLQALQERSEHELRALLSSAREEEVRRLCRAMFNLKKYTGIGFYPINFGNKIRIKWGWDDWKPHFTYVPLKHPVILRGHCVRKTRLRQEGVKCVRSIRESVYMIGLKIG